jgi:hypothetical protein
MNTRARDLLIASALGGICHRRLRIIQLLLHSVGCLHLFLPDGWDKIRASVQEHSRCRRRVQRRYDIRPEEWRRLDRESGLFGWDFLTIAWQHSDERRPVDVEVHAPASHEDPPALDGFPRSHLVHAIHCPPSESEAPRGLPSSEDRLGYTKPCRTCGVTIYLHHDSDGRWRPYESWRTGRAPDGTWWLHHCN